MSLNFAAITPHPPIIVPGIGKEPDLAKAGGTIMAMKKLANIFQEAEIDTLVVISPHMLTYPDRFSIGAMKKLFGSFASFGSPEIMMEFTNNLELARKIDQKSKIEEIQTLLYDNDGEFFELDHGLMVPLFYLTKNQESAFRVIPIAYSHLNRANHFSFGQILGETLKKYPSRCGLIASGDLSHRLLNQGSAHSSVGQEFDQKIIADLKDGKTQDILYYDEEWVEEAGECGYRSTLILLGALGGFNAPSEILSYEGPFGVGYLVANFKMPE